MGFGVEKAGVVEVRLVDGGLGRIGLLDGLSPPISILRRDIGKGEAFDRLEVIGVGRWLALIFRLFAGKFGLGPVVDGFEGDVGPSRLGLVARSISLRRVAVGG